jgi:biopolymer transport protein ExbD
VRHVHKPAIGSLTRPNSEINVTPLVDVVLVLLIIFMVVTPLLEKDIGVRVPPTEKVENLTDVPPDQLVVRLTAEGKLEINGEETAPDDYVAKLSSLVGRRSDKTVFVVADDKAPYPGLVHLLDGAKQAGAQTLGMGTEAPLPPQ